MPAEDYIGRAEHQEFVARMESENKRLEDENERQNHRIGDLEEGNKQINNLALSVQELASSVKTIAKETERLSTMMEKNIQEMDVRLKKLENVDGDKWRDFVKYVGTTILGIFIGFIFRHFFGMG